MDHFFVVLQDSETGAAAETVYPEVHYVFSDDAFAPEMDALERQEGDISVVVDLDETAHEIRNCQSISPDWQVTNVTLETQALGGTHNHPGLAPGPDQSSRLLRITGTSARQNLDVPSLQGSFESQVARGLDLVRRLESRNDEVRRAISGFPPRLDDTFAE